MKVLVVNKFFFLKGGAETVFFQERELLLKQGIAVIDFSMQHTDNLSSIYQHLFVSNVDYYDNAGVFSSFKTAVRFVHNQEACDRFTAIIEQEKPDIVHFHNIYHQITPSVIKIAKEAGCKTVLTAHDTKIACPSYTMYRDGQVCELCLQGSVLNVVRHRCQQGSLLRSSLLAIEALYQSFAGNYQALDVIVCPSEFMAGIIRRKLPDSRIEVIVNGIDNNVDLTQVTDERYFLYLGRLSKEKGVTTLVKAYQMSSQTLPLKIVGTGPLLPEAQEQQSNLHWLGFQQGEQLHRLIQQATAVIVPSECYENCSMAVLEAMAYGKPVIGAEIGGIPEQVRDKVEGRLFESGNAQALASVMDECAMQPELMADYGKQARMRLINKYSLENHERKLLALYQQLMERPQ